jgi:DNA-binding response OmpR family regulator
VTASTGVPERDRVLEMGAAEYLAKPLSAVTLREAITRILHQTEGLF